MAGGNSPWIQVNKHWASKTKTDGPSLRLWWIVADNRNRKRWIVKNLKAFCNTHYPGSPETRFYERDKKFFYEELSRWGRAWPDWRAIKPERHDAVYNLLGTKDLKLFKGAYEKEIPFGQKAYKELARTGLLPEVKQFWNDIDFTL